MPGNTPVSAISALIHACACFLATLALFGFSTLPAQAEGNGGGGAKSEQSGNADTAIIEANNIYFQLRSTAVDEAGKLKLREHANQLRQNPKKRVTLIGHMDDLGSRNYNLAITEERLMAVSNQLRAYGVSAHQIRRTRVTSDSSPTPCRNEACRALTRMVELKYPE